MVHGVCLGLRLGEGVMLTCGGNGLQVSALHG